MIPLIAPPEIFSAYSLAEDGTSPDLAPGTHLRIFAGIGASFPLTPFAVFRMISDVSEQRNTHIIETDEQQIKTLLLDNNVVRADINELDSVEYAELFDQKIG